MDEREQLLACANQSAPAIRRLADCENKYLALYDKVGAFSGINYLGVYALYNKHLKGTYYEQEI